MSRASVFETAHLHRDLDRRIARSGAITVGTQAAKFLLRLGSLAVLGRLLAPADFGLIALVTVITGFVEVFKDAGLSTATIQRREITHAQVSTLFWLNVLVGCAITVAEMALAPGIAWFYEDPRLVPVTLALAVSAVLGAASVQHQALLRRKMQFGRIAAIDLGSTLAGVLVGLGLAGAGFGYWSLVAMNLSTIASATVFSFAASDWRPGPPQRGAGVREMVRFGGQLTGAEVLNYAIRNGDNLIVGKALGEAALGLYSRGYSLFLLPTQQFLAPVSQVMVPALSRVVADAARFRSIFLEKSYLVLFLVVVLTGFIYAGAPEIVRLILGPGWGEVSSVVRALAIGGAISGTNVVGRWLNVTHGRGDRQVTVALVAAPVYLAAFWVGSRFGIVGVALGFSVACVALRYPAFYFLCEGTPVRPMELISPLLRVGLPVAAAAAAAIWVESRFAPDGILVALALKTAVYGAGVAGCVAVGLIRWPVLRLRKT